MKLIDKDALVAKIDDWRHNIMMGVSTLHGHQRADATFEYEILGIVRDFLDTLEVKEVAFDVEEELKKYGISSPKTKDVCIASHFFELGMKVSKGE